jgi:hypothetical protein
MKYAKMLGLLAVAAAALMAFAGSASATTLTDGSGGTLGVGTVIEAGNVGEAILDGTVNIKCKKSTVKGEVTNAGGASATVSGSVSPLTFSECGANTVTVSKGGTLEIHGQAGNKGTLTSSGAEVTVLTHNILGTVHCIYTTEATDLGTVEGGTGATLKIDSVPINRASTDFGCGSTSEWTAHYTVSKPATLNIDA